MNLGQTVFSQLIEHLPHKEFQKCVARYRGDHYLKSFSCWDQFLAMGFAQLTYRESLRDIEACLRSMQSKLYHMGFRGKVSRSTLADANELRDWRIYADFAQVLIGIARPLYADDPLGVELDQNLYALDSTTIDLCLSLFPWARFRRHKAAVKMHTLLDLHGSIPTFIRYARQSVKDITQGVLLRGAPQPTTHPSRFLAERSADSVDDTTPHNRDVFLGPSTPIVRGVMLSLDSGEKLQRHHRQRRGES